ncbi:MAG TPA: hypothetical protein VK629_05715 [Steroidobacteraceae bacterium]|nr:hypothetical protein [Steroidobacteraceae bacterium]
MPVTRTILIYKFDELSDEAKEKARDWWREHLFCDSSDWEFVYDDANTIAALFGLEIGQKSYQTIGGKTRYDPAIFFSGFSSQGDGACFEGRYRFRADALEAVKDHAPEDEKLRRIVTDLDNAQKASGGKIGFKITTRGNYSHSHSMEFELLDADADGEDIDTSPEAIRAEDEKAAIQALRDYADWIYDQLETEYNYQNSDEQVDEAILANAYEFTEEGKRA